MQHHITSFIDGRVRLRHPMLHSSENQASLRAALGFVPGIKNLHFNSRTGSLLLEYDPELLQRQTLLDLAAAWLPEELQQSGMNAEKGASGLRHAKFVKATNRGMIASLGTSLAFLATGRSGVHAAAGCVFLALNLLHMYTFRKAL